MPLFNQREIFWSPSGYFLPSKVDFYTNYNNNSMKNQTSLKVSLYIEQEAHKLIKVRAHKRKCDGKVVRVRVHYRSVEGRKIVTVGISE